MVIEGLAGFKVAGQIKLCAGFFKNNFNIERQNIICFQLTKTVHFNEVKKEKKRKRKCSVLVKECVPKVLPFEVNIL